MTTLLNGPDQDIGKPVLQNMGHGIHPDPYPGTALRPRAGDYKGLNCHIKMFVGPRYCCYL